MNRLTGARTAGQVENLDPDAGDQIEPCLKDLQNPVAIERFERHAYRFSKGFTLLPRGEFDLDLPDCVIRPGR